MSQHEGISCTHSFSLRLPGKSPDMFLKRKAAILTCSPFSTPSRTSLSGMVISALSPSIGDIMLSLIAFDVTSLTRNTVLNDDILIQVKL